MTRIAVTGGTGKAGRAVVKDLVAHEYEVINLDVAAPPDPDAPSLTVDLTDFGQTVAGLEGVDAVVHLAAIPAPRIKPEEVTFRLNMAMTFNVFEASRLLGIERVVWASSETTIGLPFDREKPAYAPIDEDHPLYPESSYALSKVLMEEMARQYARRFGMVIPGLRFSNVMETHDYERFPTFWEDANLRRWNLWGYIPAEDAAQSCRLALEADLSGAEAFIIAAADTCMNRPSRDLMAEVYPNVEILKADLGEYETLLSIDKARAVLGYQPTVSWRDYVDG